ncbi:ImmA/IrrE family metallo-endopeptidase [Lactobacillus sp. PSON]|uniref:ImmA/IrrE family metallo-endopeptidase n=1 Tax=Lactobacillus sp. PSON TaxID=3455454 RepID=UPI004042496B
MNTESRKNFNKLIMFLMNYCNDHGIGIIYDNTLPPLAPSRSYTIPGKLVAINGNWYKETEIPFIFAHEIGHVIENLPHYYHASKIAELQSEYFANDFAINLLQEYCFEEDIWFESIYDFAKCFGIPRKHWDLLDKYQEEIIFY